MFILLFPLSGIPFSPSPVLCLPGKYWYFQDSANLFCRFYLCEAFPYYLLAHITRNKPVSGTPTVIFHINTHKRNDSKVSHTRAEMCSEHMMSCAELMSFTQAHIFWLARKKSNETTGNCNIDMFSGLFRWCLASLGENTQPWVQASVPF